MNLHTRLALMTLFCSAPHLIGQTLQQQGPLMSSSNQNSHRRIIGVSPLRDPAMVPVLAQHFPGLATDTVLSQFTEGVVLIKNWSRVAIKAYVLRWDVTEASGATKVIYAPAYQASDVARAIPGKDTVLAAYETRIVSPQFNWSEEEAMALSIPSRVDGHTGAQTVLAQYRKSSLGQQLQNALRVQVSVDAIVYADGREWGVDSFGLAALFEGMRDGSRDEARSTADLLRTNGTNNTDSIVAMLEGDILEGKRSEGSTKQERYLQARAHEALLEEELLKRSNPAVLSARNSLLSSIPDTQVTPLDNSQ